VDVTVDVRVLRARITHHTATRGGGIRACASTLREKTPADAKRFLCACDDFEITYKCAWRQSTDDDGRTTDGRTTVDGAGICGDSSRVIDEVFVVAR